MYGEMGRLAVSDDEERLQCHICGQWYRSLAAHVLQTHQYTVAEYREEFGLNRNTPLVGRSLIERSRAVAYRANFPVLGPAHLQPGFHGSLPRRAEVRRHISETLKGRRPDAMLEGQRRALAERVEMTCQQCGVTFEVARSRVMLRKFCDACRRMRKNSPSRRGQ
jgi:uncharacterized protein YbaR (Trm112 family)